MVSDKIDKNRCFSIVSIQLGCGLWIGFYRYYPITSMSIDGMRCLSILDDTIVTRPPAVLGLSFFWTQKEVCEVGHLNRYNTIPSIGIDTIG